jgi:hypothetical protein
MAIRKWLMRLWRTLQRAAASFQLAESTVG